LADGLFGSKNRQRAVHAACVNVEIMSRRHRCVVGLIAVGAAAVVILLLPLRVSAAPDGGAAEPDS
jgi:hypothetical protein